MLTNAKKLLTATLLLFPTSVFSETIETKGVVCYNTDAVYGLEIRNKERTYRLNFRCSMQLLKEANKLVGKEVKVVGNPYWKDSPKGWTNVIEVRGINLSAN